MIQYLKKFASQFVPFLNNKAEDVKAFNAAEQELFDQIKEDLVSSDTAEKMTKNTKASRQGGLWFNKQE